MNALSATGFQGASVVITGAGRRGQVGEVVSATFARHGATVILIDRDAEAVRERAEETSRLGAPALAYSCDLTNPDETGRIAQQIADAAPSGISAVVHMAGGYVEGAPVADTDPASWHKLIAINLTTAFVATRALLPLVRQCKGSMVYFATASSLPGGAVGGMAAYAAAKVGVVTLMRAVASEEKPNGVRANAIAPTAIRTSQNLASMGDKQNYVERETIAAWVMWLCSEEAGPVTGQVIRLG